MIEARPVGGTMRHFPAAQWSSTAITYEDCGCSYDHVAPPLGSVIRSPMVIVSPYANAAFTDSRPTSFNAILGYIEHTPGLAPLSAADSNSYDYSNSFDYSHAPLDPVPMGHRAVAPLGGAMDRDAPGIRRRRLVRLQTCAGDNGAIDAGCVKRRNLRASARHAFIGVTATVPWTHLSYFAGFVGRTTYCHRMR